MRTCGWQNTEQANGVTMKKKRITVTDEYQRGYVYELIEPIGRNFDPEFTPDLTPKEMLELGVFGGLYFGDKPREFPRSWFAHAKLAKSHMRDKDLNFFKVNASQSRKVWLEKGWIHRQDPRGWFQWYCRYYLGRRTSDDARQIARWKGMARHVGQIRANCKKRDLRCRPRQRQALLHWAINSRKL